MSLTRTTRRSGLTLIVLGLLGAAFFWVTDPRFGPTVARAGARPAWYDPRSWLLAVRGSPANPVDAANDAAVATLFGFAGCACLLLVGLWLVTRKTV